MTDASSNASADSTGRSAPRLAASTIAVTTGRPPHEPDAPLNHPVTLAATYVAGGDREYGRYHNPTWEAFEETVGALEGGRALTYASGLATVSAILAGVPRGGVVVAPRHAYLGTLGQLDELGAAGQLSVRLVDIADTEAVQQACVGADLIWIESPTNPAIEVADLPAICAAARAADATSVVDNTFATPLLQRPLEYGADIVVHSATKFLAGHADAVLGVLVTNDDAHYETLLARRKLTGAIPGTFETWLALRGVRTLPLRAERACANAAELATRLAEHPGVQRVRYPGLVTDPGYHRCRDQMRAPGAIMSVDVAGGAHAAEVVTTTTRTWVHATSLGGVESTLERRRRWASEQTTIPDNLIRLSIGIEDVEDLWSDLEQALTLAHSTAP